jgi:hypothetical protein
MANETILAQPACDRFGRLYTQVPVNYTPPADRAAIPTVMDVQPQDTVRPVVFDRVILRETAQVASSGVYATPTIVKTYYSLSPGHVPGKYGSRQSYERLLLSTQAQSNTLCGLLSATLNNEYPSIPVTFAGTYRVFDIAPVQIADLEILATDNPRGVGFDGDAIPKNISYVMEGNNYLSVTVDFAAQVDPDLSADGEGESENNWPPIPPLPIPIPPNPIPPLPPVDPTLPAYIFVREGATGIWMYSQFTGEWTNVTESLDPVERALIGQFNPGQYGMAIQRFSTGGGLYCVTNTKVFRGDTTYGFRIMYNTGRCMTSWASMPFGAISLSVRSLERLWRLARLGLGRAGHIRHFTGSSTGSFPSTRLTAPRMSQILVLRDFLRLACFPRGLRCSPGQVSTWRIPATPGLRGRAKLCRLMGSLFAGAGTRNICWYPTIPALPPPRTIATMTATPGRLCQWAARTMLETRKTILA